jgi:hypothetical protein
MEDKSYIHKPDGVGHQIIVEDQNNNKNPDDRRLSHYCEHNAWNDALDSHRCNMPVRIYLK